LDVFLGPNLKDQLTEDKKFLELGQSFSPFLEPFAIDDLQGDRSL
jgi:hypothetical protein